MERNFTMYTQNICDSHEKKKRSQFHSFDIQQVVSWPRLSNVGCRASPSSATRVYPNIVLSLLLSRSAIFHVIFFKHKELFHQFFPPFLLFGPYHKRFERNLTTKQKNEAFSLFVIFSNSHATASLIILDFVPSQCRKVAAVADLKNQTTTSNVSWRLDFFDFLIFPSLTRISSHFHAWKTQNTLTLNFQFSLNFLESSFTFLIFTLAPNFSNKAVSTLLRCAMCDASSEVF